MTIDDEVRRPVFTGRTSLSTKVAVAALRVLRAVGSVLGVDILSTLFPLVVQDTPPWYATRGLRVEHSEFDGWPVSTLCPPRPSGKYVVAIHGGGYALGPAIMHWPVYAGIARNTAATVVVPLYPLVPEGTAGTAVPQCADLLTSLAEQHGAENISVIGDSAGGGLAFAAIQELICRGDATPGRMVLISPWLDVSMTNPDIASIDDPILSSAGLRAAGRLWAGGLDPTDPLASPLYGSLEGLPPTAVYTGSLDMLAADVLLLRERAIAGGADFTFDLRRGGIHGWPYFLVLPEARAVLPDIYRKLVGTN